MLPGLVDSHVHINDPGRAEWEGFETATRSAAAGGVTTLVDMPLNSIPATTSVSGLHAKEAAARGRCWVDVGLWGGVVPGNTDQIAGLVESGVLGFKCFLTPSGVDEFPNVRRTRFEGGGAGVGAARSSAAGSCRIPCPAAEYCGRSAGVSELPRFAPAGVRRGSDRAADRDLPNLWESGSHRSPGVGRRCADASQGAGCGVADYGRDLSALSGFRG